MTPQTAQKHKEAKLFLDSLGISPPISLLLRVMSFYETRYGKGWDTPYLTHNWGAITATPEWKGQTFSYADPKYGEALNTQQKFRAYPNDEAGVMDMLGVLSRKHPDALRLASLGKWEEISASLFGSGYYTGRSATPEENIKNHAESFLTILSNIVEATKEKSYLVGSKARGSVSAGGAVVVSLILLTAGYIFYSTTRGRWLRA